MSDAGDVAPHIVLDWEPINVHNAQFELLYTIFVDVHILFSGARVVIRPIVHIHSMAGRDQSTSTEEVLAVFQNASDACEPFTAPQITEELSADVHRNTARNYLQDLASLGKLRTKKVGAGRVWWQPCERDGSSTE